MILYGEQFVVVPYLFLVWYNSRRPISIVNLVVVPYLFLVWYNGDNAVAAGAEVVVPYLFLVWYNLRHWHTGQSLSCSSLFIFGMV